MMNIISANEYWVKAGSLVHTDLAGNDMPDPANVRNYLMSGTQHASPAAANSLGVCQQFGNSVDQNPALRALWVDLDQWIDGTAPPAERRAAAAPPAPPCSRRPPPIRRSASARCAQAVARLADDSRRRSTPA